MWVHRGAPLVFQCCSTSSSGVVPETAGSPLELPGGDISLFLSRPFTMFLSAPTVSGDHLMCNGAGLTSGDYRHALCREERGREGVIKNTATVCLLCVSACVSTHQQWAGCHCGLKQPGKPPFHVSWECFQMWPLGLTGQEQNPVFSLGRWQADEG